MIALFRQLHQSWEFGAVEKQGAVFDDRTEGYDKAVSPPLARHLGDIDCQKCERAPEPADLLFPISDNPLRLTALLSDHLRRTVVWRLRQFVRFDGPIGGRHGALR